MNVGYHYAHADTVYYLYFAVEPDHGKSANS